MKANRIRNLILFLTVAVAIPGSCCAQFYGTRRGGGDIPRMPLVAPSSTDQFLKIGTLSPLTLEWSVPAGGGASNPPGYYYDSDYSIDPANSGATNSANMQTAIDAITAAGGGVLFLDVGTYEFAQVGASPYNASRTYCFEIKSNVLIRGRSDATILKLANGQQTDAADCDMAIAGNGSTNFGFENLTMTQNTAGQTGYTGGYQQAGNGGTLITTGILVGGAGGLTSKMHLVDITFDDCYSVPANIVDCDGVYCHNISVDNAGEGLQFARSDNVNCEDYLYNDTGGNAAGDGFELANSVGFRVVNFKINDSVNGSGLDIASKEGVVANGTINNCANGIVVQNYAANFAQPNATDVIVANVVANMELVGGVVGDAFSVSCSDTATSGECDIAFIGCVVNGPGTGPPAGLARGFQANSIGGAPKGEGRITFTSCAVNDMNHGFSISNVNKVSGSGNVVNRCTNGVIVNSSEDSVRGETSVDLEVHIFGCTGYGVTDTLGATHGPVGSISGYWAGNGTSLTSTSTNAQAIQNFQANSDWIFRNLRPIRAEATAASTDIVVSGERAILFTHSELRQLLNAHDRQILTVVFANACSVQGNHLGAGRNIDTSDWRQPDNAFAANESITLQYSQAAGLWYELSREQFDYAPTKTTTITGGEFIEVNASAFTANDAVVAANVSGAMTGNFFLINSTINTSGSMLTSMRNLGSGPVQTFMWAGTGDASVRMLAGGDYSIGVDNSDSDKFKISNSSLLGTNDRLEMLTTGEVGLGTDPAATAQLTLPASTTSKAPVNIPAGSAPTSPVNGDIWTEGTDLKIHIGGTTYTITKS